MDHLRMAQTVNRRVFLARSGFSLGAVALGSLLGRDMAQGAAATPAPAGGFPVLPHFAGSAKRVIYLFQSGAPSQMDLFDYKPALKEKRGIELPNSIRMGQRITTMTSGQKNFPVAPSIFKFARQGKCGAWLSELLPHTARIVDDICLIKSMQTEAINHDPAITFVQTGSQLAGRPSMGAWVAYGLGSPNKDLPAFVVLVSRGTGNPADQPLYDRLWGSGFLPTKYQGVKLRGGKDPVLYLANPAGCSPQLRRDMLNDLDELNQLRHAQTGDPEILTRIAQYELAYRMQSSVPELTADNYGRDHHPRCFSVWMAGGGIKAGTTYGETDDFSYNIVRDPVEVYDLNATILHLMGVDHTRMTFKFQGRDFRLTDVHGKVVRGILA